MSRMKEFLGILKRYLFAQDRRSHQRPTFCPGVEILEDRTAPAVFTWTAGAAGNWEDPNNWDLGAGFPKTANDTATLNGANSVKDVTLGDGVGAMDITIGRLLWANNYSGQIKLKKSLIISSAGGLGISVLDSPDAKIAPQNAISNLVLDGASLTFVSGTIGSTTNKSTIEVKNNGVLLVNMSRSVTVGMNIVVGTVAGGAGKGSLAVKDSVAGFQGNQLYLTNDASLTVNKDSGFTLAGKDGDGWILDADGGRTGIVTLFGNLFRSEVGVAKLDLPVLVNPIGALSVGGNDGTSLQITSSGEAGTNNASIYVQGGTVALGDPQTGGGATLIVPGSIIFDGGSLFVDSTNAHVQANFVEFKNNAELNLDHPKAWWDELVFDLTGNNAKVKLTSGTWTFNVGPGAGNNDYVLVQGGDLEINTAGTTLTVVTQGAVPAGESHAIIDDTFAAIIGDFAMKPMLNYNTYESPDHQTYYVSKK